MRPRRIHVYVLVLLMTAALGVGAASPANAAKHHRPRWMRHVLHYSGGISNGVRERVAVAMGKTTTKTLAKDGATALPALENVQMNGDTDPPLPQDEPGIAVNLRDSMNAVAASNDYTGDGFWIGTTHDGGQTWASQWKDPKFSFDDSRCYASDPGVVYSLRDHAFYMSTLCYFPTTVGVGGPRLEVRRRRRHMVGVDAAVPGRLQRAGRRDVRRLALLRQGAHRRRQHALEPVLRAPVRDVHEVPLHRRIARAQRLLPVQAAYTDSVPTGDPSASTWHHVAINPDDPGGPGRGQSANQFTTPVVDDQGGLNVAFVHEDCNTSYDRGIFFARSTDGGQSFSDEVRVDRPGEWVDNSNRNDYLPGKGSVRFPGTISLAYDATRSRLVLVDQNAIGADRRGDRHLGADLRRLRGHLVALELGECERFGRARSRRPVLPGRRRGFRRHDVRDLAGHPGRQPPARDLPGHLDRRRPDLDERRDQLRVVRSAGSPSSRAAASSATTTRSRCPTR